MNRRDKLIALERARRSAVRGQERSELRAVISADRNRREQHCAKPNRQPGGGGIGVRFERHNSKPAARWS